VVIGLKYKKKKSIIIINPDDSVGPQINQDEIRLMRSFYGFSIPNEKKNKDEKENQWKFYSPID